MTFRRFRSDDGNTLIVVIFVSLLLTAAATLSLTTGEENDWHSTRDKNSGVALGVAEAAVHEAIADIETRLRAGTYVKTFSIPEKTTPQGRYHATVTRSGRSLFVEAWGSSGDAQLSRSRHVRVMLGPPPLFPDGGYALMSFTSATLSNNDQVYSGDIWANDSITATNGVAVTGSITSAQSWIDFSGDSIGGNVWSGGRNASGHFGIRTTGTIGGWAKASMSSPGCVGDTTPSEYDLVVRDVAGDATAKGAVVGGPVHGQALSATCTAAAPAKALPPFTFNRANYDDPDDPDDYGEFTPTQYPDPLAAFQTFLISNGGVHHGTYYVIVNNPSQASRLDLSGLKLSDDTLIVTNAPVFANQGPDDSAVPPDAKATFTVVSNYTAPPSSSCDYNKDSSECAIHFKNGFDPSCKTATLLYADNAPIALKNTSNAGDPNNLMCGAVIGEAIVMKNNQSISYDGRVESIPGFGDPTYVMKQWQELPL